MAGYTSTCTYMYMHVSIHGCLCTDEISLAIAVQETWVPQYEDLQDPVTIEFVNRLSQQVRVNIGRRHTIFSVTGIFRLPESGNKILLLHVHVYSHLLCCSFYSFTMELSIL